MWPRIRATFKTVDKMEREKEGGNNKWDGEKYNPECCLPSLRLKSVELRCVFAEGVAIVFWRCC